MEKGDKLLYRQVKSIKAGQTERFIITYTPEKSAESVIPPVPGSLWLKVKNKELIALRAAYLAGPYVLYVDCKPEDYDPKKKCFITAEQPVFEPQLLPGQSFYAELSCHIIKDQYCWVVDITSQIIFNNTICVDFEITIGTSREILRERSQLDKQVANFDKVGSFVPNTVLQINNQDTYDLWNLPLPNDKEPIHLVILTHGLHSNVSADMLYLKEQIDSLKENVVVKGFFGNVGKTERGIRYLGSRVAEYVVDLVSNNETFKDGRVNKISFIGHSLGGLVQTFAIAYIENNFPWFFKSIKPINFIALASPLLGVVHENPRYVKIALLAGIVGKTGQDLGLYYSENDSKPLLLLLPTGPTHRVLKTFVRRTVYSNIKNDGIVPLRTASLLFLDYKGLSQILKSDEVDEFNKKKGSVKGISSKPLKNEDTSFLPVQAMLAYFMPQKRNVKDLAYHRFQTMSENEVLDEHNTFETPATSVLETATSLFLPPLPSLKYITDPNDRENVILHDKMYSENDLPPKNPKLENIQKTDSSNSESTASTSTLRKRIFGFKGIEELEEMIAREYHKNMTWRKVLVQLKPDAHNNIIVRRRFSNAYGWSVIEHLVENHFDVDEDSKKPEDKEISKDSLESMEDLASILSRDLNTKQNNDIDIDIESKGEDIDGFYESKWINAKDNSDSMFAVGPTGLLSDVSEMVGNLRDHWYNVPNRNVGNSDINLGYNESNENLKRTEDLGSKQVMGNFI